ncbi:homocysteine S-methyltransferase family protein [Psychrobacter sp. FDAARGOS_221]|uniref:homocysteine S-methyltransferase family protein n=1 Tax=Psychrobacter sp. FDAARGOS_221 TaxID=1975705 RepID=UPI0026C644CF
MVGIALIEAPETVAAAHLDFIDAGAQVITVNSYAVTPFHLGDRFYNQAETLINTASDMAIAAVSEAKKQAEQQNKTAPEVRIAGCLPPLFGSYRPDLFDEQLAESIAKPLIIHQQAVADIWLAETVSSVKEAVYWHKFVTQFANTHPAAATTENSDPDPISESRTASKSKSKPFWIAFTLEDSHLDAVTDTESEDVLTADAPKLRSGESLTEAIMVMLELGVDAILFNCSQPEVMMRALETARLLIHSSSRHIELGVYANAFAPKQSKAQANSALQNLRQDTTPENYLSWAKQWQQAGATIIGGCCGIGTEHIAQLSAHLTQKNGRQ